MFWDCPKHVQFDGVSEFGCLQQVPFETPELFYESLAAPGRWLYLVSLVCVVSFNLDFFEAFFLSNVLIFLVSIFVWVQLHDVSFHVCFADTALSLWVSLHDVSFRVCLADTALPVVVAL